MTKLTRRNLIAEVSAVGLSALALSSVGHASAESRSYPDLNLNDPESNLETYVKLRGDLAGDPVYDLARGTVFALIAGEPARPLFKLLGAQRSVFRRVSSLEYHATTRYVGVLLDLETDQPLKNWLNPLNNKRCEVPASHYGPVASRVLTDRMVPVQSGPTEAPRTIRPWFVAGGVVHLEDQIFSPVSPEHSPDADLMMFSGEVGQVADPATTRAQSQLSFTAVETWRKWMQMEQPGSLWWHVAGVKLSHSADYPLEFRQQIVQVDPEFFTGDSA